MKTIDAVDVDDRAYEALVAADSLLAQIAATHGRPDPFSWGGQAAELSNFAAMVLHIVSQQLSTRVALVLFDRITDGAGGAVTPRSVTRLGATALHELGLSRAKASSLVDLAQRHQAGTLDTNGLSDLNDAQVIDALSAARGVGRWTAEMFLIHQLRRPDVLPAGDLGIRKAVQAGWTLPALPTIDEVDEIGRPWTPWRTYAAALLWASLFPAPVI